MQPQTGNPESQKGNSVFVTLDHPTRCFAAAGDDKGWGGLRRVMTRGGVGSGG
ncbi:MAG: hypothetical protein QM523_07210 [Candidatus Pacebacteria bacterium]|nr:hypothetical protein [Candidatus Paceibacterota bacterium]